MGAASLVSSINQVVSKAFANYHRFTDLEFEAMHLHPHQEPAICQVACVRANAVQRHTVSGDAKVSSNAATP